MFDCNVCGLIGFAFGVIMTMSLMILTASISEAKGMAIAYKEELEKLQSSTTNRMEKEK